MDREQELRRLIAETAEKYKRAFMLETELWTKELVDIYSRRPTRLIVQADGIVDFDIEQV